MGDTKTLEQEARERLENEASLAAIQAYSKWNLKIVPQAPANYRSGFRDGYLAAATARDKRIAELEGKLTEAKAAIRWMHGYDEPGTDAFPICPEGKRYAWRGVSRQQFAIVREACAELDPRP